jgi:Flp pilus assembly pilin Flp
MFKNLWCDEEGASTTEYILLVALIAIAAFAAVKTFGGKIIKLFEGSTNVLDKATPK